MHGVEMSPGKGPWMVISARCKRHSDVAELTMIFDQTMDGITRVPGRPQISPEPTKGRWCPGAVICQYYPSKVHYAVPMFLSHLSYYVHALQGDARREKKGKGSYQKADRDDNRSRLHHTPSHSPTLLITSPRHAWRWCARRVQAFARGRPLPAFCFSELSLASPVDGFTLAVPIWY